VPAKINLCLSVGPLRADGFHELVTVFHAVDLVDRVTATRVDRVTATRGGTLSLSISGNEADGLLAGSDNLAWKAATLLAQTSGRSPEVALALEKSIPVAAGLAGGSADAAATLVACDQLWGLNTSPALLNELAARLGSDVAFALRGGTAIGTGRGEQLEAVPHLLEPHFVLAAAAGGLSTPEVYARLDRLRAAGLTQPDPRAPTGLVAALQAGDLTALAAALHNDLQAAALDLAPQLADTLAAGSELGALGGIVCGSGPTCVFLAADAGDARRLAQALQRTGLCRWARAVAGNRSGALANVRCERD
jgi:4-diphosphocytidyl-2-C-methyl-D-erythritol kinase